MFMLREDLKMAPILRRAVRGFYWVGLLAGPFFGTVALVGGAFVAMQMLRVELGVFSFILIGMGILVWMGLIWAYRNFIPFPCIKCGHRAKATSLDPITIRCGTCGHVEIFKTRVLGAP